MKKAVCVLVVLALAVAVPTLAGFGQEKKVRELMRRKLDNAQKVLEGIALNDFDKIGTGADELIQISKATDWKVLRTTEYDLRSNEFRNAAVNMAQMAKNKNVDGAALAYVDMTLTCVKCHKHVREVRMARRD